MADVDVEDAQGETRTLLLLNYEQSSRISRAAAKQQKPILAWKHGTPAVMLLVLGFALFAVLAMFWDQVQSASHIPQPQNASTISLAKVTLGPAVETANSSAKNATAKGIAKNATANGSAKSATANGNAKNAMLPSKKVSSGWPSLFCFALMQEQGPELALMKSQFKRRAGIFACDDQAVFCDGGRIALGPIGNGTFRTLPVPKMPMTKGNVAIPGQMTNSWLNTKLFMKVYVAMMDDGRFWAYDWVVKVDPDAVFFPDRLRKHLEPHTGLEGRDAALYVRNCGKNPWIHLLGAIEVFSGKAMQVYFNEKWKCETQLQWSGWGEDYYMEHCMDHLGVRYVNDYTLLGQCSCENAGCEDGWRAAFHPFKDVGSWWQCWEKSAHQY